jgi:hypothetical protein
VLLANAANYVNEVAGLLSEATLLLLSIYLVFVKKKGLIARILGWEV